ncbi:hypothetical protein Bca4012_022390 [Brassica carinata]
MGNCALKPKVLTSAGAPAPEELETSLLEYQKIDAAKSLRNLFLQAKAEKKTKEDEKTTPKKIPLTEDLKTTLTKATSPTKEIKSPTKETKSPATETQSLVTETQSPETETKPLETETQSPATETKPLVTETQSPVKEKNVPADDLEVRNEETVGEEKVIDDVTVKETETEAKTEEVRREAAAP